MAEETDGTPLVNGDSFEIQVEIQRQINQLRQEQLNYRFKVVDWWLAGVTLIFVIATLGLGSLVYSDRQETSQFRTEAKDLKIETENFIETLRDNANTISDLGVVRDLRDNVYRHVPVDSFIPVVVASGQVSKDEITTFINNAYSIFVDPKRKETLVADYQDEPKTFNRWSIRVEGGGEVMIFRTSNDQEFTAAWDGVSDVLEALKNKTDLTDITILVRGTERFYDIKGIEGVGGRTWIAFDLR